jgi:predicted phosphodiesterase
VDAILHAGRKGEILGELDRIAPVTAVRGNNVKGEWAKQLPHFEVVEFGDVSIYVLHDLKDWCP